MNGRKLFWRMVQLVSAVAALAGLWAVAAWLLKMAVVIALAVANDQMVAVAGLVIAIVGIALANYANRLATEKAQKKK